MKQLTATQIRSRFGKCIESAHKQMGLRDVRTALFLAQNNPIAADDLLAKARTHLAYAEAITARLTQITA